MKFDKKEYARQIGQTVQIITITLSRGLYRYVKSLFEIDLEKKIYWHELPKLFEKYGYKRPPANEALEIWKSISASSNDNYAQRIIDDFEDKLFKIKINGDKFSCPKEEAYNLEKLGDEASKQGNYSRAISYYRYPLERDPISHNRFLVKIASCLNLMGLYADLVPLTLFALKQVSDKDGKSMLYGFLGSAFYDLALKTLDETNLQASLEYYERSKDRSWGLNLYAPWNSFELQYKFSQEKQEQYEKHLRGAKLDFVDFKESAFIDFDKLIVNQNSNFKDCIETIITDAKKIRKTVQDQWLIEQIDYLISIKH